MFQKIICPISSEKIDSNLSRLTVFIQALLLIVFIFTLQPLVIHFVTIDCALRAAGKHQYSPICLLAANLLKLLGLQPKMVDKAPKIFASRLGFICASLGSVFIILNMPHASIGIIAFFTVLAMLDSVANFCVGCIIYHHFVFPFYSKN